MTDRHCPFLNRDDPRCNAHLRVNALTSAFDHCASNYAACPSYRELLAERVMRRAADRQVHLSVGGRPHAVARRNRIDPVVVEVACPRWSVTAGGLVAAA